MAPFGRYIYWWRCPWTTSSGGQEIWWNWCGLQNGMCVWVCVCDPCELNTPGLYRDVVVGYWMDVSLLISSFLAFTLNYGLCIFTFHVHFFAAFLLFFLFLFRSGYLLVCPSTHKRTHTHCSASFTYFSPAYLPKNTTHTQKKRFWWMPHIIPQLFWFAQNLDG